MPPFNEASYPGCVACGLWKYSRRWKIDELTSDSYGDGVEGGVMVLVDFPSRWDIKNRSLCSTDANGGKFLLEDILAPLDVPWVVVPTLRCNPGVYTEGDPDCTAKNVGKDRNPGVKRINNCATFLDEAVALYRPKVIVGLGDIAMTALFDRRYPLRPTTVSSAYGEIYTDHHTGAAVMISFAPGNHTSGNRDLTEDYGIVFSKAQDICRGVDRNPEVTYTLIDTPAQFRKLVQTMPKRFCGDFETKNHLAVREWKTIHHIGAKALCFAVSFFESESSDTPKNFLITPNLFGYTALFEALFRGRVFVAHNAKFDCQVTWVFIGVCPMDLCEEVFCTLSDFYVRDQAYIGNSLEKRAMMHLGVDGWKWMVDEHLKRRNLEITEIHKQHTKKIRAIEKFIDVASIDADESSGSASKKELVNKAILKASTAVLKASGLEISDVDEAREWLDTLSKTVLPVPGSADFSNVPTDVLYLYCCTDTDRNIRLDRWISRNQPPLPEVAKESIRRTMYVTLWIERTGLPISQKRLNILTREVDRKIARYFRRLAEYPEVIDALLMDEEFYKLAEEDRLDSDVLRRHMSPKSPTFLLNLAITTDSLENVSMTADGNYSFDKKSLEKLSGGDDDTDPLQRDSSWTPYAEKSQAQIIWMYISAIRKLFDLRNRFIKDLNDFTCNGRIRTNYKTCKVDVLREHGAESKGGAGTGRLSSSDPNLQNQQNDDALRSVFTPHDDPEFGPDWVMVEYDYDRIEPVCLTVVTGCKLWREAISRRLDLYRFTGNRMYAEQYGFSTDGPDAEVAAMLKERIPTPIRNVCKVCTLAVMYGMSKYALSAALRISLDEADKVLKEFFDTLPEIREWQTRIGERLKKHKPIRSWFGKVRHVHDLPRHDRKDYFSKFKKRFRESINWPIQGMASEITVWKTYEVIVALKKSGLWRFARPSNIVHDSDMLLIRKDKLIEVDALIRPILTDMSTLPFEFDLPLTTTMKLGYDWGSMKEIPDSPIAKELGLTV